MGDQLLESRLFGYKKGAFTDAVVDTLGVIVHAKGGTVFLDEIGDISTYMQQALLRVLQEKEITPVGGTPRKTNVRFVCATNKELPGLCGQGPFRWDLYYRLAVIDRALPAVRERGIEEVKQMIYFFLKLKRKLFNVPKFPGIHKIVMDWLLSYPFQGNV